jgi:hypothetical protein
VLTARQGVNGYSQPRVDCRPSGWNSRRGDLAATPAAGACPTRNIAAPADNCSENARGAVCQAIALATGAVEATGGAQATGGVGITCEGVHTRQSVGKVTQGNTVTCDFASYRDQLTPETAGNWGSSSLRATA